MKRLHFENMNALAEFMVCGVADKEHIVATLFFDEAKALVKALLQYENIEITAIDMNEPEFDGYCDEYYVSILENHELFVSKAMGDKGYLLTDADIMFISPDASSAIVIRNDDTDMIETYVGEDDGGCEYTIIESSCAEEEHQCECGCHCGLEKTYVDLESLCSITLLDAIMAIANNQE